MGEEDVKRQALNVFRMELLGAKVEAVTDGSRVLKDAGALLGIPVTDHVILGGEGFFSFAEAGEL